MIRGLYEEFLVQNCLHLPPDSVQHLTSDLAAYLCRTIRAAKLMSTAKLYGVDEEFRTLRRRLDSNPQTSSRTWRAAWLAVLGAPNKALREYRIDADDLEWLLGNLTVKRTRQMAELASGPWIRKPDYAGIEKEILSTRPFVRSFVAGNMKFLAEYDPGLSVADFEQDMFCAGLSAAYRSDGRTSDLVYIRNIAFRSAKNHGVSVIKHHTTQSRQRIVRQSKTLTTSTMVRYVKPDQATKTVCLDTFKTAASKTVVENCVQSTDNFRSTMTYLDAVVSEDSSMSMVDNLPDSSDGFGRPDMSDLTRDIGRQHPSVQQVCGAILGHREDPLFSSWLRGRYGEKAESLRVTRLAKEACEFYGVPPQHLQRAMAPVLGVDLR